jgi:hypothetical protein
MMMSLFGEERALGAEPDYRKALLEIDRQLAALGSVSSTNAF